jgi:predicted TIM-barrel fold metal-dependent hydrolase
LGPSQPGFGALLDLARAGVHVKLSAPYRVSAAGPDYTEVAPMARALIEAAPERMLWGSDWPHTSRAPGRVAHEISPFRPEDGADNLALLGDWTGDEATLQAVLVDNPTRFYGFG